jgi:hypothetical protein
MLPRRLDANTNDNTNEQVELDVERAKVNNDIDHFYEGGLIDNFTNGAQDGGPDQFKFFAGIATAFKLLKK